jgi:uncharacterized membrane protein
MKEALGQLVDSGFDAPPAGSARSGAAFAPVSSERNKTVRIEAFSDGVFAIAMTLLVLGITVPKARDLDAGGSLGLTLARMWPHYLAFVTSFITILAQWVNHHRIFNFIEKTDHAFLYWNGLLLLFVTFLPFPTALLAEYLLHSQAGVAGAVFVGTYAGVAFSFKGLWHHASKNGRLLTRSADYQEIRQITLQYRYGPLLYLAAFALSFLSVVLSVCLCLCLAVYFASKDWPTLHGLKLRRHRYEKHDPLASLDSSGSKEAKRVRE